MFNCLKWSEPPVITSARSRHLLRYRVCQNFCDKKKHLPFSHLYANRIIKYFWLYFKGKNPFQIIGWLGPSTISMAYHILSSVTQSICMSYIYQMQPMHWLSKPVLHHKWFGTPCSIKISKTCNQWEIFCSRWVMSYELWVTSKLLKSYIHGSTRNVSKAWKVRMKTLLLLYFTYIDLA